MHPPRRFVLLVLSLVYAAQVSHSASTSAPQASLRTHDHAALSMMGPLAEGAPSAQTSLLDRIGRLFDSWIPSDGDMTTGEGGGGFFGGDSATFAWGGSTLEVVVSRIIHHTPMQLDCMLMKGQQ